MKKILTTNDLKRLYLDGEPQIDRADISVFTAESNDEVLKIHREKKADLIITRIDQPGMRSEHLFDAIRQDGELKKVSTILICEDNLIHQSRCKQCAANAIFALPVDKAGLISKVLQLLDVAPRRAYRVTLNVAVEGKFNNKPFLHRTEDISATGMLIKAKNILVRGDRISFSFYLPGGMRVSARGEVERIVKHTSDPDTCLYGIKFIDLDPPTRAAIDSFVARELTNKNLS